MIRPGLRLGQRQVHKTCLLPALALLRMDGADLAAHLAAEALRNPFLRLRLPAGARPLVEAEPLAAAPSLHDHVRGQIGLRLSDPADLRLALLFLDALEPSGWLGRRVEAIAGAAGVPMVRALAMLDLLQGIEPAGLFARDLRDCLRLQAADRGQLSPVMERVLDRLDLLAAEGPAALAARAGLTAAEVAACLAAIRRMDPKPGARFEDAACPPLREPDLVARRAPDGWTVELNRSALPAVHVAEAPAGRAAGDLARLRREARELQRALIRRGATVLAVGAETVRVQREFLDHGPAGLRPLRLAEVARPLGLHPSTVSRVVSGLLLDTPRGIVPVRMLFPAALAGGEAGAVTASDLQGRIRALVAAEDARRPLDDEALAAALARAGLVVARRTVAKHRALAGIPPVARRHAAPQCV